ncbi:MAG: DUF805 domain-containing protein [Bacteroidota bacterium]
MKTLEGLHALIKSRLIEKMGNVKLIDNVDIIIYGKALGFNENELLFKVLEIEETIDWAEEELKRTHQDPLKIENASTIDSMAAPSQDNIYFDNCNDTNQKGFANHAMLENPFSSEGRITRTAYGISIIITVIFNFINKAIIATSGKYAFIGYIGEIIRIWFILAQGAKRCHDRGNSGWFQLIPFYILWMLFADSDKGINEYGLNPKGIENK